MSKVDKPWGLVPGYIAEGEGYLEAMDIDGVQMLVRRDGRHEYRRRTLDSPARKPYYNYDKCTDDSHEKNWYHGHYEVIGPLTIETMFKLVIDMHSDLKEVKEKRTRISCSCS